MPIGPEHDPIGHTFHGVEGFVQSLIFDIFQIIGTVLGLASATAASAVEGARKAALRSNPNVPLTTEQAVVAALKGAVPRDAARDEATSSGTSGERFDALYESAGNPPGPMELVAMWRRGLIDRARMQLGLRQGFLRNDWVDFFDNLRHEPLSAVQYLEGAVQGHMALDEALAWADRDGLTDHDARLIFETLGNPPGVMEMLHLWNRGVMNEGQVDQGIRESRYKDKYIPALKALREYLPPPRTITTLITHGALTPEAAQSYFEKAGLSADLARAYVASAMHTKTASHKELAVGTVKSLYADRLITRAQAVDDMGRVGYGAADANLVLDLADAQARQKLQASTITAVRHLFVTRRVDAANAQAELARLGLDPGHVDDLLALWKLEQGTPTKTLTLGQLNAALKKGLIDRPAFLDRVTNLGYDQADAELLSEIDVPIAAP